MSTTSIVIPLNNPGPRLMSMVQLLIETTPADGYEVIIVDRGSTDGTKEILGQLGGDVVIADVDASLSLGAALNTVLHKAKGDAVATASVNAKFFPGWLDQLRGLLLNGALAILPGIAPTDLFGIRMDYLHVTGIFDEHVPDDQIMHEYVARVQAAVAREARSHTVGVDPQALGINKSLAHIVLAAREGAGIGELPVEHAERLRDRLQLEEERRLLVQSRAGRAVCWTDEGIEEPLVTVRVTTRNRAEQLMDICLPSVLNQSYENIELLIVGDDTDEATEKAMKSVTDPRVRFFNLPYRPLYPRAAWDQWKIVGSEAMNVAMEMAQGSWICPADDDDEYSQDHVEVLLSEARQRRLEFVWSKTLMKTDDGWQIIGSEPMGREATTHCAVMWSSGLRFMRMSTTCWKLDEEADQNMWRRMHSIGVKMGFVDKVTYRYIPGAR